ncbi:hypothetical protein CJF41_04915 [Pseudomonas lundensis]|nr:hypothetical protein CJF41_04915 [Pseudomonas lundensis]
METVALPIELLTYNIIEPPIMQAREKLFNNQCTAFAKKPPKHPMTARAAECEPPTKQLQIGAVMQPAHNQQTLRTDFPAC